MEISILLEEVALLINARNHGLTPKFFLNNCDIDLWKIDRVSMEGPQTYKVIFCNGLNLIIKPDSIILIETIKNHSFKDIDSVIFLSDIIKNNTSIKLDSVDLKPRCFVGFSKDKSDCTQAYLKKIFLNEEFFSKFDSDVISCSIQLSFPSADIPLLLRIDKANIKLSDQSIRPSIVMTCDFSHPFDTTDLGRCNEVFLEEINSLFISELDIFQEVVYRKILSL